MEGKEPAPQARAAASRKSLFPGASGWRSHGHGGKGGDVDQSAAWKFREIEASGLPLLVKDHGRPALEVRP